MTRKKWWGDYVQAVGTGISAVASILSLVAIGFAWMQLSDARKSQDTASYAAIADGWHDHMETFVEHPKLRPYFFDGAKLEAKDPLFAQVIAMADVRLDAMDRILEMARLDDWSASQKQKWEMTFIGAFKRGPVLCDLMRETGGDYGDLTRLSNSACASNITA